MNPPAPFLLYRVLQATSIALILLFIWIGLEGHGPMHGLANPYGHVKTWFESQTGVTLL
jgi:hypothetical protein